MPPLKKRASQEKRAIKQEEPGLPSEHAECSEDNDAISLEPAFDDIDMFRAEEPPDPPETQQPLPEDWEERMKQIAREVYQENSPNMPNVPHVFNNDEPPQPQTLKGARGRKEDRQIKKISATIDRVLGGLFEKERKRRGLSTGRLLDIILWQWYGKPKLSYGEEQEDI